MTKKSKFQKDLRLTNLVLMNKIREPRVYPIQTKRTPIPEGIICKFCSSKDLVRYGKYNDTQLYLCRKCGRKGTDNNALPGMKVSSKVVDTALSLRYEGLSYCDIKHQLKQKYGIELSISTIYNWVVKYSKREA